MIKIWVPVKFNKNYLVSNYGEVYSLKRKRLLTPYKMPNGSLSFSFPNKAIRAHKLVFNHFRKSQIIRYKHLIMHTDFNRENNKEPNLEKMQHGDVLRKWFEHKKQKRGVYKWTDGTYEKWRAVVKFKGKAKTIGYFSSKTEAEAAYYTEYTNLFGNAPY